MRTRIKSQSWGGGGILFKIQTVPYVYHRSCARTVQQIVQMMNVCSTAYAWYCAQPLEVLDKSTAYIYDIYKASFCRDIATMC